MTGTTVKNVNQAFAGFAAGAARNARGPAAGDSFQTVFYNQTGGSAQKNVPDKPDYQTLRKGDAGIRNGAAGESLRARETRQTAAGKETPEITEEDTAAGELTEEQLQKILEVLNTAVQELLQQTADVFGVSMEELQGVLGELGFEPLDMLQPENLGELVLALGGAEDSSALVTDEALYDNYQSLMAELQETVADVAEELETAPKQVQELIVRSRIQGRQGFPEEKGLPEDMPEVPQAPEEPDVRETPQISSAAPGENQPKQDNILQEGEKQNAGDIPAGTDERETAPAEKSTDDSAGNSVVQEIGLRQPGQEEVFQTGTAVRESAWTPDTQDIMRQIMDYMKIQLNADSTSMEMQLHPANLGSLQIQVQSKAGVVTANFVTQNEAVKAALESQMIQLKESFAEQGVKVEAIEVTVQPHAFERNLDQGRGQEQGGREAGRRPRTRRINLNDSMGMDGMEEEEALAARLMEANGNTVDYTA